MRILLLIILFSLNLLLKGNAQNIAPTPRNFKLAPGITSKDYIPGIIIAKFKQVNSANSVTQSSTGMIASSLSNLKNVTIESVTKKFNNPATSGNAISAASKQSDQFGLDRIYEIKYSGDSPIEDVINELLKNNQIEYAEPNYIQRADYTTNDPSFGLQTYLTQVKAPEAWNIIHNSSNIIIGIVDSGSDLDHPDLAANIYLNTADPINGKDDDNDGYIDNYRGWDMTGSAYIPGFKGDNDPNVKSSDNDHGVHVSGIASAVSDNNIGVSSIASSAKLLIVKCAADGDFNSLFYNAYAGIVYAVDHGAKIINCSWGGDSYSDYEQDIINYALNKDCLIIATAGNDDITSKHYPASYAGVISVASVDNADKKSDFSNYGSYISISAPGSAIYNTIFNNTYGYKQGTSMASPLVASAAALVKAYFPSLTMKQVGQQLIATADNIENENPNYTSELGSGRLNVYRALTELSKPGSFALTLTPECINGANQILINWTASSNAATYELYRNEILYYSGNATGMQFNNTAVTAGTSYTYYVKAINVWGTTTSNTLSLLGPDCSKPPQTITFTILPSKTYGDADFDPGATSSSGLPVSYTSGNTAVASIVSGKIHIISTGTTTITASQAGNSSYSAATTVSRTLTVSPKSITVTAASKSKTYGDSDPALTYTVIFGGLVGTDAFSGSLSRAAGENAGMYAIGKNTLTLNGNYDLTFITGDLTINPKDLKITANNINKPFGTTLSGGAGSTAFSSSGLVGSESIGSVTMSYGSGSESSAPVNTYAWSAVPSAATGGTFIASNYYISYAPGNIIVTKLPQTITFSTLPDKTYGNPDFDLTAIASSGLPVSYSSSNTAVATILNGKVHIVGAGTATITASQSGNTNYAPAPDVNLALKVNKASQTITFNTLPSKTYGDADFDPGATASSGLPISYTSSNTSVATILNGKVHIIGAGTTTITPSQSGNANYASAPDVNQTLTVNKATQTITFAVLPVKNYNDADFDPGAKASSGLPLSYTSNDPSVATIVNGKVHIVAEGTVTITASQGGNTNYNAAADVSQSVKIIFTLPVSNFKISATSETCKTSNNGLITITAVKSLNYTASITGNSLTVPPYNFTGSLEIKDLSAGTYTVCITVAGQSVYKQCYDINITEPKDLALYSTIDRSVNKISLNLEGGSLYKIELNGIRYQTSQNQITLPLLKGNNHLKVATDKECQGIIEKRITLSEDILIYPNPFENILNLNLGNENSKKAQIEVRTIDGKLVYSKQDVIEYGKISLDLSSLDRGTYLLKVSLDHSGSVHKILKK